MAQFRRKPQIAEAIQWFPGVAIAGVRQHDPEIVFSRDGELFYLSALGHPPDWRRAEVWLAVDPEDKAQYPFALYHVNSGERMPAVATHRLVRRYLEFMEWPYLPPSYGYLESLPGRGMVHEGNWVIRDADGGLSVCDAAVFWSLYEPVEENSKAPVGP